MLFRSTIFVREGEEDTYRKFEETHYQRGYQLDTIIRLVQESGLEFVQAYDAFSRNEPHRESERIYIIAREKGK